MSNPSPGPYPEAPRARDRWTLALRPGRYPAHPRRPAGWFLESERGADGRPVASLTVLLTNRECPWRCVFCDLWRYALPQRVSPGDIPAQLAMVLDDPAVIAGAPPQVKLYNAGSYFDPQAIPPKDDANVAALLGDFDQVIVEAHPAMIGERCWRFRDRLARQGRGLRLEVAMGLETANPAVLERLNKRLDLDRYRRAADLLLSHGVGLRAFVLVQPPFQDPTETVDWAVRSVRFAFECGADVVSLIPVRAGNGALEALRQSGQFTPPTLATLEAALDGALAEGGGRRRVFADLWDLERFATCPACFEARSRRLAEANDRQSVLPPIECPACGGVGGRP